VKKLVRRSDGVEATGLCCMRGFVIGAILILIELPSGIGPGRPPDGPFVIVMVLCAVLT
jgi:hypothetical protein